MSLLDMFKNKTDTNTVGVNLEGKVSLPQDIVFELMFRQQTQLVGLVSALDNRLDATEAVTAEVVNTMKHLHDDFTALQNAINAATAHPVDKIDITKKPDKLVN